MSRGQSTVVGTILLVAVVVVSVTTFGLFSLSSITDRNESPMVDIDATLTVDGLALTHAGGDPLDATALIVRVDNDTDESFSDFEAGNLPGDDRFAPGERWTNASTLPRGDRLTVWLIHEPSNSVLFQGDKTVGKW